jgi:RNA 2',3'-cyclic 3'-phosphodiesterase
VWPAPEVTAALASLPRPAVPGLRWSGPEQWHITLRFFGELDGGQVGIAQTLLADAVDGHDAPVTATGGAECALLGPGLVVWPVAGLDGLATAIERATCDLGQAPPGRPFYGHVTLARARKGTDLRRQRHVLASLAAQWQVRTLCLVESQLHPQGARYRDIVELALPGAVG